MAALEAASEEGAEALLLGCSNAAHAHRERVGRQVEIGARYTILLPQGGRRVVSSCEDTGESQCQKLEGSMLRQRSLTERHFSPDF